MYVIYIKVLVGCHFYFWLILSYFEYLERCCEQIISLLIQWSMSFHEVKGKKCYDRAFHLVNFCMTLLECMTIFS